MKWVPLMGWIAILVVASTPFSVRAADGERCTPELPSHLAKDVARLYPQHRIVTLGDLSNDDQRIWKTSYPNACVGIVLGRFSTSSDQIALLLRPADGLSRETKVILVGRTAGAGMPREIFSEGKTGNLPVLRRSKPGTYKNVQSGQRLRSHRDVLLVEHLEATVTALIVQESRVRVVPIAD